MSLYLNESKSPYLSNSIDILRSVVDRLKDTTLGSKVACILAACEGRPFFQQKDRVMTRSHKPTPDKALKLTDSALAYIKKQKTKSLNLSCNNLIRCRAEYRKVLGQVPEAKKELATLRKDLEELGVDTPVLKDIKSFEDRLGKK